VMAKRLLMPEASARGRLTYELSALAQATVASTQFSSLRGTVVVEVVPAS